MKDDVFFILFLGVAFANDIGNEIGKNDFDDGYVDNPDNYEEIVRPCQVYDLNCIRRFFTEHSKCQIRNGPVPGRLIRSQFSDYLPRLNFTLTVNDAVVTGLDNSRIEEFYYNKATNKVVIAIEVRNLTTGSELTYFRFYRQGREPISVLTTAIVKYPSIIITMVIPNIDDLQFDFAEITTFVPEPSPLFYVGPELLLNPEPTVRQAVADLLQDLPTNNKEQQLTETAFYAIYYVQTNICDFGLKFS